MWKTQRKTYLDLEQFKFCNLTLFGKKLFWFNLYHSYYGTKLKACMVALEDVRQGLSCMFDSAHLNTQPSNIFTSCDICQLNIKIGTGLIFNDSA